MDLGGWSEGSVGVDEDRTEFRPTGSGRGSGETHRTESSVFGTRKECTNVPGPGSFLPCVWRELNFSFIYSIIFALLVPRANRHFREHAPQNSRYFNREVREDTVVGPLPTTLLDRVAVDARSPLG